MQSFSNPQTLNRYSYCLNNPLKYIDPTGHNSIEYNIPQEWLGYSFFERIRYLTLEELAYLHWALNPPPLEGDPLPASEPPLPASESSEIEWDNSAIAIASGTTLVLAGDNITGIGFVDDILIPGVWIGAGATWVVQNWDNICHSIGNWWSSLWRSEAEDDLEVAQPSGGQIIADFENNPDDWEKTGEKTEPATNRRYRGGTSHEEYYTNRHTVQRVEIHRLYDRSGRLVKEHYRIK